MAMAADTDTWKMGGSFGHYTIVSAGRTLYANASPGVMLADVPTDASSPAGWDFAGSTMVVRARSREEILGMIRNDIYVREGVWDLDKMQAWPVSSVPEGGGEICVPGAR